MIRIWLFFFSAVLFLGSCVPNRNYVYLQKDDVKRKDMVRDSVLRSYDLQIKDYKIQPLDILSVQIESLTEDEFDFMNKLNPSQQGGGMAGNPLLMGFLVDNNGSIEFPVIGKINVSGFTTFMLETKMQELFKVFLKNPVARVRLLNFRFTILGEVRQENQVLSNNTRVTLMEAVGLAGGLTDLADRSKVKIIRQKGDKAEVIYMDLLHEELLSNQNYYVHQNDIIIVPPLRQRPFRNYWSQNIGLFVSALSLILITINLAKP